MSTHYEDDDLDYEDEDDEGGGRFVTTDDIYSLADVLEGTDDSLEIGLSQVGIDPDEFSRNDLDFIRERLSDAGLELDKETGEWTR